MDVTEFLLATGKRLNEQESARAEVDPVFREQIDARDAFDAMIFDALATVPPARDWIPDPAWEV